MSKTLMQRCLSRALDGLILFLVIFCLLGACLQVHRSYCDLTLRIWILRGADQTTFLLGRFVAITGNLIFAKILWDYLYTRRTKYLLDTVKSDSFYDEFDLPS